MKFIIICHLAAFLSVTTYTQIKGSQMTYGRGFHVLILIF